MDRKSALSSEAKVANDRCSPSSGASRSRILRLLVAYQEDGEGTQCWVALLKFIHHLPRSYYKGVELGYLTKDPSVYHDPDVCAPYIKATSTAQAGRRLLAYRRVPLFSCILGLVLAI